MHGLTIKDYSLHLKLKQHPILPENHTSSGQIRILVEGFVFFVGCLIFIIERFIENRSTIRRKKFEQTRFQKRYDSISKRCYFSNITHYINV